MPDSSTTATPESQDWSAFLPISAEVLIKGRSAGYLSLYDDKASGEISAGNLKRFISDPKKVTQTVALLKKAGFSIPFIGRNYISIRGTKQLFESTFNVDITIGDSIAATPRGGSTATGIINVSGMDVYEDLIAGVGLNQPVNYNFSTSQPPSYPAGSNIPAWAVTPQNMYKYLQRNPQDPVSVPQAELKTIDVTIIDSGVAKNHEYFTTIPNTNNLINVHYDTDFARDLNQLRNGCIELENKLKSDYTFLSTFLNSGEINEINIVKKFINNYIDHLVTDDSDFSGHGTMVCANIFSFNQSEIRLNLLKYGAAKYRSIEYFKDIDEIITKINTAISAANTKIFDIYNKATPNSNPANGIISMSVCTDETNESSLCYNTLRMNIKMSTNYNNTITLYAAGNSNTQTGIVNDKDNVEFLKRKQLQPQWPEVIAVGGAYWDNGTTLKASAFAHGYCNPNPDAMHKEIVPDICGLCGNDVNSKYLVMPSPKEGSLVQPFAPGWIAFPGGCSAATPQVAGVCALIRSIAPQLDYIEVKTILQETAVPVGQGEWFSNKEDTDKTNCWLPIPSDKRPGLANIPLAIRVASELSNLMIGEAGKLKNAQARKIRMWYDNLKTIISLLILDGEFPRDGGQKKRVSEFIESEIKAINPPTP